MSSGTRTRGYGSVSGNVGEREGEKQITGSREEGLRLGKGAGGKDVVSGCIDSWLIRKSGWYFVWGIGKGEVMGGYR